MKNKKGFVWIEAVLYIALGVVAISLILSAGLPLINKMRDRNTVLQTKDIMHAIDKNIWQVRSEGVGSRRTLEPVIIKDGKLMLYDDISTTNKNKIIWEMKTKTKMMESCEETDEDKITCTKPEGNLKMYSFFTPVKDEYLIRLELDYTENIILSFGTGYTAGSGLVGNYGVAIKNIGGSSIELTIK